MDALVARLSGFASAVAVRPGAEQESRADLLTASGHAIMCISRWHPTVPRRPTLEIRQVSRLFKALGDETRLRIVGPLSHCELWVRHVQGALGLTQPNASRQLGILRNAAVVESRREGTWTYYKLAAQADGRCGRQLESLVRRLAAQGFLKGAVEGLLKPRAPAPCRSPEHAAPEPGSTG